MIPDVEISSSFIGGMSLSFFDRWCVLLGVVPLPVLLGILLIVRDTPYSSEYSTILYYGYYLSFMFDPRLLIVSRRHPSWMWAAASVKSWSVFYSFVFRVSDPDDAIRDQVPPVQCVCPFL